MSLVSMSWPVSSLWAATMSEATSPPLGRARRGRCESQAERDRGGGARGRELDDAKAGQRGVVGVEPPAKALVELLGLVDVGHGDDVDLEVHVDHVCLLERFLQLAGDFVGRGLDSALHDSGRTCERLVESFFDGWLANRD